MPGCSDARMSGGGQLVQALSHRRHDDRRSRPWRRPGRLGARGPASGRPRMPSSRRPRPDAVVGTARPVPASGWLARMPSSGIVAGPSPDGSGRRRLAGSSPVRGPAGSVVGGRWRGGARGRARCATSRRPGSVRARGDLRSDLSLFHWTPANRPGHARHRACRAGSHVITLALHESRSRRGRLALRQRAAPHRSRVRLRGSLRRVQPVHADGRARRAHGLGHRRARHADPGAGRRRGGHPARAGRPLQPGDRRGPARPRPVLRPVHPHHDPQPLPGGPGAVQRAASTTATSCARPPSARSRRRPAGPCPTATSRAPARSAGTTAPAATSATTAATSSTRTS